MSRRKETGSEHEFLEYKRVDVHFIYSFLWKTTAEIKADVFSKGATLTKPGWKIPLIHERIIGEINGGIEEKTWVGSYQPNFVFERRCIEINGDFTGDEQPPNQVWLVVPMTLGASLPQAGDNLAADVMEDGSPCVIRPILASWTMRLFDSGTGTFTVRLCINKDRLVGDSSARFSLIHWLLRLTPNVDAAPDNHDNVIEDKDFPIVDSFIYTPSLGTCRLYDLMIFHRDKALGSIPVELFEDEDYNPDRSFLYADERSLAYNTSTNREVEASRTPQSPEPQRIFTKSNWHENQTPFLFITAVTDDDSLARLHEPSLMLAKEIASLCAKLTLDNRRIHEDLHEFSIDYLVKALDYDQVQERLLSLSHDHRLFFTFSKRGALAISAKPNRLPALFVIPSLLNLFELAKARLHSGVVLGARLAELASRLASMKPNADSIDEVEYAHLRKQVVLNLHNPMQYLFDGGSVTELAILIEKALFINQVWRDVQNSFEMVDRLMAAWETTQLRSTYGQSY